MGRGRRHSRPGHGHVGPARLGIDCGYGGERPIEKSGVDVGAWLRELGLGQYEQAFNDNAIDGEVLPRLGADDAAIGGGVYAGAGYSFVLLSESASGEA